MRVKKLFELSEMNNPLISIITVCFNSEATIGDAILSVLNQNYKNIQIIVIDGASKDNTIKVIRSLTGGKNVFILSEPDYGIYDAMNKGIKYSTGEIVGFLNSDDMFANINVITTIVETMKNQKIDACYSDLVYVSRNDTEKYGRYWKSGSANLSSLKIGWIPPHPTFYARKEIYTRFGHYKLEFGIVADHELMSRFIGKYKIRMSYIPKVLIKMRYGGASHKSVLNILRQNILIIIGLIRNRIGVSPLFLIYKTLIRYRQLLYGNNKKCRTEYFTDIM